LTSTNTEILESNFSIALTAPPSVLAVSGGVDELLGFKADDFLTGKLTLQSRIHPHDQDIVEVLFSTDIKITSGTFNIRLRHADSRIRCIKGQYTKVKDPTTKIITLELLLQDAKSLWQKQCGHTMMTSFKAMMENTHDYIYFKDRNHVFTGASQTLVAITDPSEHWTDLIGKTDYDVFSEEYADNYYDLEKQVFNGVHVAHQEQETLDNTGNKGWVDNRKEPIKNDDGEIVGLFGIARDITSGKLIENSLARSETKFRTLFDSTNDAILMLDEKGFFDCNQAALDLFGLQSGEEISTYHPADLSPPIQACGTDSVTLAKRYIKTAMQEGTAHFEWFHKRVDSETPFFAEVLLTSLTLDGRLILQTTVRNITDRKKIESELKENQERLSLATMSNGVGVWDLDLQTMGLVWDNSMFSLYHIDRADFTGAVDAWEKLLHPDDRERSEQELQDAISDKKPFDTQFRVIWPNGEVHYIKAVAKVFRDENGKALRMLGTNVDITEHKHLEEELTRQAHLDYLTGLSNRRHFMAQGEVELSRAIRYDTPLSALMLDIDSFKKVNDTYGHQAGDNVLQALSKVSQDTLRQVDIIGRIGGEEFAVILPETEAEEALNAAERLREAIAKTEVAMSAGLPIRFTVSIGAITLHDKDTNIDMLLNQADKALYEAKETGRNKVCVGRS